VRTNLFSLFNNILFAIGIALIAMGRYNDALTSVGIGLVNALIATVQELRAKRKLERIALLTRPTVTVLRDGAERNVDAAVLVEGDVLLLRAGDQVVVDGPLLSGPVEVDESQLTGESDPVRKGPGEQLLSGSFCVTGQGRYAARQVGAASFANKLAAQARQFQVRHTPLQRHVDLLVRLVMAVVAVFSIIIFVAAAQEGLPAVRLAQIAAVLSGQVPYGLFFMVAVAYALGAAAIARKGALTQEANAIESLSSIDVLCTDKTGTLTANKLRFHDLVVLDNTLSADDVRAVLGDVVASATARNATSEAILAGVTGRSLPLADEVPFASARKWSAVAFEHPEHRGVYVLGAAELLRPFLPDGTVDPAAPLSVQSAAWAAQGLRVLLLAANPEVSRLRDAAGEVELPPLRPLALVSLSDELRPQVQETLAAFRELGVAVKVISGDDPQTVAALSRQAGFPPEIELVAGPQLAALEPAAFDAAARATIFGRITPEQKQQIVEALQRQGKRVAMIGDGVNDVLSLKQAALGIAMESGSGATRNVADMVLLGDSFAALPPAFREGQHIVGGMVTALYLFLTRVATTTLLIIAVTMLGLSFPFDPAQVALTTFTVGLPAFFLTLWARPQPLPPRLLRDLARFVFPIAVVTMLLGAGLYVWDYNRALGAFSRSDAADPRVTLYEEYTGI
jgi:cation-transporting ATPase E